MPAVRIRDRGIVHAGGMADDPMGEVIAIAVGLWLGRRLTRPELEQNVVTWREMWRQGPDPDKYERNPKTLRVFLCSFGGFFVAFGLRWFSDYIQSSLLAVLSVYLGVLCLAVGIGAIVSHKYLRKV